MSLKEYKPGGAFSGVIGRTFDQSEPAWPEPNRAKLYGPFVESAELRVALPLLQRAFKFRTCKLDIDTADVSRVHFRPCILYNIKQCTAPCADRVSAKDYADQIKRLRQFMESKGTQVRKEMTEKMKAAADALEFERAAELRDELKALQSLQRRGLAAEDVQPEVFSFAFDVTEGLESLARQLDLRNTPRTIEGIDIAHLQGGETCGSSVCFIDGKPFKGGYRRYKIRTVDGNDDFACIREVVRRRYRSAGNAEGVFPDIILIDGGKGQLSAAWDALNEQPFTPPTLLSLAKKEEIIHVHGRDVPIKLPRRSPALKLLQAVRDEAHRFVQHYHHILRRKATLGE